MGPEEDTEKELLWVGALLIDLLTWYAKWRESE